MNVLRMVKLFGWEKKMDDKIAEKRDEELVWIKKRKMLDLLNGTIKLFPFPFSELPLISLPYKLCDTDYYNDPYVRFLVSGPYSQNDVHLNSIQCSYPLIYPQAGNSHSVDCHYEAEAERFESILQHVGL